MEALSDSIRGMELLGRSVPVSFFLKSTSDYHSFFKLNQTSPVPLQSAVPVANLSEEVLSSRNYSIDFSNKVFDISYIFF